MVPNLFLKDVHLKNEGSLVFSFFLWIPSLGHSTTQVP